MQARKPAVPLKDGMHLILAHALRCTCNVCERILDWEDCDNVGVVIAVCCKKTYKLQTWTVKVSVDDGEEAILMPPHKERFFPIDGNLLDYGKVVNPDGL